MHLTVITFAMMDDGNAGTTCLRQRTSSSVPLTPPRLSVLYAIRWLMHNNPKTIRNNSLNNGQSLFFLAVSSLLFKNDDTLMLFAGSFGEKQTPYHIYLDVCTIAFTAIENANVISHVTWL